MVVCFSPKGRSENNLTSWASFPGNHILFDFFIVRIVVPQLFGIYI